MAFGASPAEAAQGAIEGLVDPFSTPFDRSAGLGSDKVDHDYSKYYDSQGRPRRSAWPANTTDTQGKPITDWSPEINENNMMLAWLQGQAQKQELTTTRMQQKRLGIK